MEQRYGVAPLSSASLLRPQLAIASETCSIRRVLKSLHMGHIRQDHDRSQSPPVPPVWRRCSGSVRIGIQPSNSTCRASKGNGADPEPHVDLEQLHANRAALRPR